jgi:hypothetical protein
VSKKVLKHPDKDEIIRLLSNGESVRGLESKLREKYPKNKNLWISSITLQGFRKDYLNLEGQVLKDIQEAGQIAKMEQIEKKKIEQLEASDAYKKKISEIADSKLDVARKILELDAIIGNRMEYWFNAVASGTETPTKGDKELRQFMDRQMVLLGQYKKFVEGLADKTIDYNVNVTIMNDQVAVIRDVIQECLNEFEPDVALRFMEKLSSKLGNLPYRQMPVKIEELNMNELKMLEDGVSNGS